MCLAGCPVGLDRNNRVDASAMQSVKGFSFSQRSLNAGSKFDRHNVPRQFIHIGSISNFSREFKSAGAYLVSPED